MRGYNLVAVIFVREVDDHLTSLVKNIDRQLEAASPARPGHNKLGVFFVFCNDSPGLKQQLMELAAKEGLKQVVLATHDSAGPQRYRVAREADITAVIYRDGAVAANIALRPGMLKEADRAHAIFKAVGRVLPKK